MEAFREIKSIKKLSVWRGLLLLCVISSAVAAALLSQMWWLGFAALAMIWFLLSYFREPAMVTLLLDEGGISVREQAEEIRFADLQAVTVNGGKVSGRKGTSRVKQIEISHSGGVLVVPCPVSVPVPALIRFLEGRIPTEPRGDSIRGALADWRNEQVAEFGEDRVAAFGRRAEIYQKTSRVELTNGAWAFILVGLALLIYGSVTESGEWVGLGIAGITISLFLALFSLTSRSNAKVRAKAARQAGIVVSPAGIALAQDGSVGKLEWEAILDIGQKSRSAVTLTRQDLVEGLQLKLVGTRVLIHDVFELPLSVVEARLREYWREPA